MENLQELTGRESGIVIYDNEAIICNWRSINGYPRLDPTGLCVIGLGEDIPDIKGEDVTDIASYCDGLNILYNTNSDILIGPGVVYIINSEIIVITPDDWN